MINSLTSQTKCFETFRNVGYREFMKGNYEAAVNNYVYANNKCEDKPQDIDIKDSIDKAYECKIYRITANNEFEQKNYEGAKGFYQKILKINPYDRFSNYRLQLSEAEIFFNADIYEDASRKYEQIVNTFPDSIYCKLKLDTCQKLLSCYENYRKNGLQHFQSADYDRSLYYYNEAKKCEIKRASDNMDSLIKNVMLCKKNKHLGDSLLEINKFEDAIDCYNRVISLTNDNNCKKNISLAEYFKNNYFNTQFKRFLYDKSRYDIDVAIGFANLKSYELRLIKNYNKIGWYLKFGIGEISYLNNGYFGFCYDNTYGFLYKLEKSEYRPIYAYDYKSNKQWRRWVNFGISKNVYRSKIFRINILFGLGYGNWGVTTSEITSRTILLSSVDDADNIIYYLKDGIFLGINKEKVENVTIIQGYANYESPINGFTTELGLKFNFGRLLFITSIDFFTSFDSILDIVE